MYVVKRDREDESSERRGLQKSPRRLIDNGLLVLDQDYTTEATILGQFRVTPEDFEFVLDHPTKKGKSDSSGRPCVWGYTEHGRHLIAVYQRLDDQTILPVTAYEVPEERQKKKKRKK